jgi:hypothetical protein
VARVIVVRDGRLRRAAPPEVTGKCRRDPMRAGEGEAKHPPPNYDVAADKAPTSLRSGVSLQLNAVPLCGRGKRRSEKVVGGSAFDREMAPRGAGGGRGRAAWRPDEVEPRLSGWGGRRAGDGVRAAGLSRATKVAASPVVLLGEVLVSGCEHVKASAGGVEQEGLADCRGW